VLLDSTGWRSALTHEDIECSSADNTCTFRHRWGLLSAWEEGMPSHTVILPMPGSLPGSGTGIWAQAATRAVWPHLFQSCLETAEKQRAEP